MNTIYTYEFVVVPESEIVAKVDSELLTRTTVQSTGTNWVEALNKFDPDCALYVVSSKTL